jgi:aryl-alcohol dehydrogenase-like predicted oxidoreductase
MFHREKMEKEFLHLFTHHGMGTTIWSPLASGALTGKYSSKNKPENTRLGMEGMEWLKKKVLIENHLDQAAKMKQLATKLGVSLPKLAIAWVLKNKHVSTAILGASKPEQLKETLTSLEVLPLLTEEVILKIERILNNKPKQAEF